MITISSVSFTHGVPPFRAGACGFFHAPPSPGAVSLFLPTKISEPDPLLSDLSVVNAFSRQDFQRLRGTEARLTSAHTGSGTAFDTIQCRCSYWAVNASRISPSVTSSQRQISLANAGFSRISASLSSSVASAHAGNAFSAVNKIRLTFCGINIFNNPCHILTDCRCTGQSRGFNTRHIDEPGMPCCLFNKEIRFSAGASCTR